MEDVNPIRLKKDTRIGELDAESDLDLLTECFLESSEFKRAADCSDGGSIVLGRVGSGKSAIVLNLKQTCENVIWLDPGSLSFQYLENSTMLTFVESLGVNLNTFYRLIWRHVLVVELLRKRFRITDSRIQANFFDSIAKRTGYNDKKRKALDYLNEWGEKFWIDTEVRVREIAKKFEDDISASIGADVDAAKFSVAGAKKMSLEVKEDFAHRATQVVNSIQIKKLGEVLDLLEDEDLFGDLNREFHVLIDGLDDNWSTTAVRCKVIRALIEEIRTFRKLRAVKIVTALRRDLLRLVYRQTRDSGFQEEKYEASIIELRWSDDDLKEMVNRRIGKVFERQYSRSEVRLENLFPPQKSGIVPVDYMLQRTLRRPREFIQFVNESIKIAENKSRVSMNDVRKAENVYSEKRLNSLYEEWGDIYPSLRITVEILRGVTIGLTRSCLLGERLRRTIERLWEGDATDPVVAACLKQAEPKSITTDEDILNEMLMCFYQIGIVGIKTDSNDTMCFSWKDQPAMSAGEVSRCVKMQIHKMVWHSLNISHDSEISHDIDHEKSYS